jgi:hypothetical protein
MLEKDPEKRLQLIEFVSQEYNTMHDEDFKKLYEKAVQANLEKIAKAKKDEEAKFQQKFA